MNESNDVKTLMKKAYEFNIDDVKARFMKDTEVSQELVDELEVELKRFLVLCSVSEKAYGLRGSVDELWHTFIIFTKVYFSFCHKVCGRYIHHTPNTSDKSKNQIEKEEFEYTEFLNDYKEHFEEQAPVHIWPKPIQVLAGQGCYGGCSSGDSDCNASSCNSEIWEPSKVH